MSRSSTPLLGFDSMPPLDSTELNRESSATPIYPVLVAPLGRYIGRQASIPAAESALRAIEPDAKSVTIGEWNNAPAAPMQVSLIRAIPVDEDNFFTTDDLDEPPIDDILPGVGMKRTAISMTYVSVVEKHALKPKKVKTGTKLGDLNVGDTVTVQVSGAKRSKINYNGTVCDLGESMNHEKAIQVDGEEAYAQLSTVSIIKNSGVWMKNGEKLNEGMVSTFVLPNTILKRTAYYPTMLSERMYVCIAMAFMVMKHAYKTPQTEKEANQLLNKLRLCNLVPAIYNVVAIEPEPIERDKNDDAILLAEIENLKKSKDGQTYKYENIPIDKRKYMAANLNDVCDQMRTVRMPVNKDEYKYKTKDGSFVVLNHAACIEKCMSIGGVLNVLHSI